MDNSVMNPLAAWANFYVIVGSAGAALTGLQFVVVALAADRRTVTPAGARAFATPTIIHFCVVLVMSALLSAPWQNILYPIIGVKLCGLLGLVYCAYILRHASLQKDYKPVLEDWVWHFAIPFLTYGGFLGAAILLMHHIEGGLFAVALLQLLLLIAGIHNAWDSAVYIAIDGGTPKPAKREHH